MSRYDRGKFIIEDLRSSNGTFLYLQRPLALPWGQTVRVRVGKSTLTLVARRSWSSRAEVCRRVLAAIAASTRSGSTRVGPGDGIVAAEGAAGGAGGDGSGRDSAAERFALLESLMVLPTPPPSPPPWEAGSGEAAAEESRRTAWDGAPGPGGGDEVRELESRAV